MGFLDKLEKALSKSAASPKVAKAVEEKAKNSVATFIGSIEGRKKTVQMSAPNPRLMAVKWGSLMGAEVKTGKYGKPMYLHIQTEQADLCSLLVSIHCDEWDEPYHNVLIDVYNTNNSFLQYVPNAESLKKEGAKDVSKITATVYLFKMNSFFELSRINKDKARIDELAAYLRGENNSADLLYQFIMTYGNMKSNGIDVNKIVIVIDPGHGYDKEAEGGNIGSGAYKYTYKSQDETTEITSRADEVPPYVVGDPNKYIVKKAVKRKEGTVMLQSVGDHSTRSKHLLERIVVFKVSKLLKLELENMGYTVWLTREKETLDGYEGEKTRSMRIDFSNDKNADYFISIHYDGNDYNILLNGAHIQYHPSLEIKDFENQLKKNKKLGDAILQSYCAKLGIANKGVGKAATGVIGRSNKAEHKILIELAYVTNPSDAKKLFNEQQYPLMAEGIAKGFMNYIENNY